MGHTAGTLRKIGIYFILRNNWNKDVPWNISEIFYWMSFFLFSTWFQYWIVWYVLKYIMQIVHVANWCIWLAQTLCKSWIWNYKFFLAQPWFSFGILQGLQWSWECIRQVFSLPIQHFVLKFWNLYYFHLLERCIYFFFKNCLDYWIVYTYKPVFRPEKKWPTFSRTFSNGFSFKKLLWLKIQQQILAVT